MAAGCGGSGPGSGQEVRDQETSLRSNGEARTRGPERTRTGG